jgi:hypothetical protein
VIVQGLNDRFIVTSRAQLVGEGDRLVAWAEHHVRSDPDLKWILGNFVEADRANENGHIFPLEELKAGYPSLVHKPLNMLHHEQYTIGTFTAAQLVNADGSELTAAVPVPPEPPRLESLAAMWHRYYPDEFVAIEQAHKEGSLFFSHETIPEKVGCPTCGLEADFAGLVSDAYCIHMSGETLPKRLIKPRFAAGAIILPPVRPGWNRADVSAIATLAKTHADQAERIRAGLQADAPELGPKEWDSLMNQILAQAYLEDGS